MSNINAFDQPQFIFKSGDTFNVPIQLFDLTTGLNEPFTGDFDQAKISCLIFDNQNVQIGEADFLIDPDQVSESTKGMALLRLSSEVTKNWKPCKKARFDIAIQDMYGNVAHSETVYFEIQQGLSKISVSQNQNSEM